jgi:acyl carrier protein
MDATQIKQEVKTVLAKQFGKTVEDITDGSDLESFGADSLDTVEIVMELEHHFQIVIEEDEYEGKSTLNSIVDLVLKKKLKNVNE